LGLKRMATVQFVGLPRPARFFLAHCALQPVNG